MGSWARRCGHTPWPIPPPTHSGPALPSLWAEQLSGQTKPRPLHALEAEHPLLLTLCLLLTWGRLAAHLPTSCCASQVSLPDT